MNTEKILILRTIVATSMAFVVRDVVERYGSDSEITIMTRADSTSAMKEIPNVDDVIGFPGHAFDVKYARPNEIGGGRRQGYDVVVVPINGVSSSYDNVIKFIKKVYGRTPIVYWMYPNKFIKYNYNLTQEIFKKITMFVSVIIAAIIFLPYLVAIVCCSFCREVQEG